MLSQLVAWKLSTFCAAQLKEDIWKLVSVSWCPLPLYLFPLLKLLYPFTVLNAGHDCMVCPMCPLESQNPD